MENYIGIDPGKTGAITIVQKNLQKILINDIPLMPDGRLHTREMFQIIQDAGPDSICFIEKSQAFPGQGVVSMFNYGVHYGQILSVLDLVKMSYQEIKSPEWKKEFNLIHKEKEDSVTMAIHLFPGVEYLLTKTGAKGQRIPLHGRADSLLIAEYGRRKNNRD